MKNSEETTRKQRKTNVKTFRLTDEDLKRFEIVCMKENIRLSDFVRSAIDKKINNLSLSELVNT